MECTASALSKLFAAFPGSVQLLLIVLFITVCSFIFIRYKPEEAARAVREKLMKLVVHGLSKSATQAYKYIHAASSRKMGEGTTKENEKTPEQLEEEEALSKKKTQAFIRNVRVKAKVLMTMMQLLGQLPGIFVQIQFPAIFLSITVPFSVSVSFDLFSTIPFSCVYPGFGFYDALLLTTMGPLLMFVIIGGVGGTLYIHGRRTHDEERQQISKDRTAALVLLISFLVFTTSSTKIFQVRSISLIHL